MMETENPEPEKASEDGSSLNRNRSFKSKQLVRSQAIRESQSPPRAASPAAAGDCAAPDNRRPVDIQITGGSWDNGSLRARRRWPQQRDLLSHAPRVACVAGCIHSQPCRQRRQPCPTKQDSGISCPDECADCSDYEQAGDSTSDVRNACSLDSDESYCRCPERRDKPKNNSLSRTDSDADKVEPTGPELVNFIKDTLNKNRRDRTTLLKIEKELHALVKDTGRCVMKFPVMTSYGRMLVHRVASLFQLNHHLDQTSKNSVTVSKIGTSGGLIPCTSFKQWCTANFPPSPVRHPDNAHTMSILKRDTHSPESGASNRAVERSKSLEQREREYERARRRIFSEDNCSQDAQWPWVNTGPVKLLTPDSGRNKLLKVQSLETNGPPNWRARGSVSKSHSFGGYGGAEPPQQPPPRLLSRQGDLASSSFRLSSSSSGYKTLSLRSTDSVTPSPTGGASPEPVSEGALVWALTDVANVPPGTLVMHPQSGRPLTNPDGSVYYFDPSNPPVVYDSSTYIQEQKVQNCEKRRGRLEKQHSFIDAEAECRCDENRKCCCECQRHDPCNHISSNEKLAQDQKSPHQSPIKNRNEQTNEPTIPLEPPANQKPDTVEPEHQSQPLETQTLEKRNEFEFEVQSQRIENRNYASPQRLPSFDPPANQRPATENVANQITPVNKLVTQESTEVPQYTQYSKVYRNDEVTSPQVNHAVYPTDLPPVYKVMQAKVTPMPVSDPTIRPVSLTNMIFQTPIPQAYPFVNQLRMEHPLQPMYQPMMSEEQKMAPSPHNETTFRIDPSYPYAPLQYGTPCASCAGVCMDPNGQHQRGYGLSYGQLEQPVLQQPYLGNVLLQHNVPHYQYQEPMAWPNPMLQGAPKVLMHELCPVYPQYPYVYPQMIPAPYPATAGERRRPAPERDGEIALRIQQIKDQMAQLSTQDKERSGNGLLGHAPAPYNGRVGRPASDESHLSSAARAIVSSIRNMQANSFQHDPRRQYDAGARERDRRRFERDDKRRPPRQPSPNWFRRSPAPAPVHPVLNHPRRPHPDSRNGRR